MNLNARVDVNFARVDINFQMAILIVFVFFSNGGHLKFSTRLNFISLKPCSLILLHIKFKIHGYNGLREKSFEWTLNGLKCQG